MSSQFSSRFLAPLSNALTYTLVLSAFASPALAYNQSPIDLETTRQNFCQRYENDQFRIEDVLAGGWKVMSSNDSQQIRDGRVLAPKKSKGNLGCLNVEWRSRIADRLCTRQPMNIEAEANVLRSEIVLPTAFIFYFDGFAYFRPKEAKESFGAANLTGKEKAESIHNGVESIKLWQQRLYGRTGHSLSEKAEFHYHSGSGLRQQGIENAMSCITSVQEDLMDLQNLGIAETKPDFVVMGHSNGGATAITLIEKMQNTHFDLAILLDAVPKGMGFVAEKITFSQKVYWKNQRPNNVERVVNIYQQSDTGSAAGMIAIRGSSIPTADVNHKMDMTSKTSHIDIIFLSETHNMIIDELEKYYR